MRERPDGRELLAAARRVLREKLLPQIDPSLRHDLLMVVNAISIAERGLALGTAPLDEERRRLAAILGEDGGDLVAANRRLAALVRAGEADPGRPARAAVLEHLRAVGRDRLAESNPRVLARSDEATTS
ncbi:MAG: hypothetical protein GX458_03910 [Phyllobacteriaceae bacterium]|nr:hypothetical protein [Phyllobacteriaceae bacterium]